MRWTEIEGLPNWVPRHEDEPAIYVWVDDDASISTLATVERLEPASVPRLVSELQNLLDGDLDSPAPVDPEGPTAAVVIGARGGAGHGPLGRPDDLQRPLRDLLVEAIALISKLSR